MTGKGFLSAGLCALATFGSAQLFTDRERADIVKYWSMTGRYEARVPDSASKYGRYQVRLTTAGSVWLREYNKRRGLNKVAPTATAAPQNEQQRTWQQWIDAKIEHDRCVAMQIADKKNSDEFGVQTRFDDKTLPKQVCEDPGDAPSDLVAFAGQPPKFADVAAPTQHVITFDDGTKFSYLDNTKMRKNYAYYRFEDGVASEGVAVKSMSETSLDRLFDKAEVSPAEARVMKAVSILEGGFDAVNTYDTGFVSVGFIQFACLKDGGNSLGEFLQNYKQWDNADFDRDLRRFGIEVTDDAKVACVDLKTGEELHGEKAAINIIEDKRLIAVFQRAGQVSDAYNAAQIRSAKNQFFPADDIVKITVDGQPMSGRIGDIIHSEAGMATLMDRKVNTGKVDPLASVLQRIGSEKNVSSFDDLALYELEIVQALRYRKDYLADSGLSQPVTLSRNSRSSTLGSRGGGSSRDRRSRGGTGHTAAQSPS